MQHVDKMVVGIPLVLLIGAASAAGKFYADNTYVQQSYLTRHELVRDKKRAQSIIDKLEYIATYRKLTREEGYDLRQARKAASDAETDLKELRK